MTEFQQSPWRKRRYESGRLFDGIVYATMNEVLFYTETFARNFHNKSESVIYNGYHYREFHLGDETDWCVRNIHAMRKGITSEHRIGSWANVTVATIDLTGMRLPQRIMIYYEYFPSFAEALLGNLANDFGVQEWTSYLNRY